MMRRLCVFLFIFFSLFSYATTWDDFVEDSRMRLGRYGLLSCLYEYLPKKEYTTGKYNPKDEHPEYFENNIEDMLRKATWLYGPQWGVHFVYQDENSFEEIYNPYKEAAQYLKSFSFLTYSKTEMKDINPVLRCLTAYDSKEYKDFIKSMDIYINHSYFEKFKNNMME